MNLNAGIKFDWSPTKRKLLAFALPALVFHFAWWAIAINNNLFYLFPQRYEMSITMIFGSMIAGTPIANAYLSCSGPGGM